MKLMPLENKFKANKPQNYSINKKGRAYDSSGKLANIGSASC